MIRYTDPDTSTTNGHGQYVASYGLVDRVKWARRFDLAADADVAREEAAEALAVGTGISLGEALSRYKVVTVQSAAIEPEGVGT